MKYRYEAKEWMETVKREWLECEKEYFDREREKWIEKVLSNPRIVGPDATYRERFGYEC